MLTAVKKHVSGGRRTQLTFDFISPDDMRPLLKQRRKTRKTKNPAAPAPEPQPPAAAEGQQRVAEVCLLLFELARKFVPAHEFRDYTTLARCAKILYEVGTLTGAPIELNATVADHEAALITHAPRYRLLRNRSIASLATIADLGSKAPAKGSPDYQKGMRDAYRHASDIAALFLEDIQNGV